MGDCLGKHYMLRAKSPVIPNAIAALLIHLEKTTGRIPHGYFKWTEGNPTLNLIRFLFLGEGDTASWLCMRSKQYNDPNRRGCDAASVSTISDAGRRQCICVSGRRSPVIRRSPEIMSPIRLPNIAWLPV